MTLDAMSRKFDIPIKTYSAKKLGELRPYKKLEEKPVTGQKVALDEEDSKAKEQVEAKEAKAGSEDITPHPTTTSDEPDKIEAKNEG